MALVRHIAWLWTTVVSNVSAMRVPSRTWSADVVPEGSGLSGLRTAHIRPPASEAPPRPWFVFSLGAVRQMPCHCCKRGWELPHSAPASWAGNPIKRRRRRDVVAPKPCDVTRAGVVGASRIHHPSDATDSRFSGTSTFKCDNPSPLIFYQPSSTSGSLRDVGLLYWPV